MTSKNWVPELPDSDRPRYIEIAESIRTDIASGRLKPGDQLPPQRQVALTLGVDTSSISRAYAEASRRGYVEAYVGRGTFVRDQQAAGVLSDPLRQHAEDARMNMPPEPQEPDLITRMKGGVDNVAANLIPLLRYQAAMGGEKDRFIAANWMQSNNLQCAPDRLVVAPGAHAAIYAALTVLRQPGTVVLCESVTYTGIRSIAAQLNLPLIGLEEDEHGIAPNALADALKTHDHAVLYLNPTLRNPTTHTIPAKRRVEIAEILQEHATPLIEDDAYCFVASDTPAPITSQIPHLGWYVAGISKVFGAGLRLALVQAPGHILLGKFSKAVRAAHIMVSPISLALFSTWVEDETAQALQASVRKAASDRYHIAKEVLADFQWNGHPNAFNIWLSLPENLTRSEAMARLSGLQLGIMPSDVFIPTGQIPEKLRVCLGGPISEAGLKDELQILRQSLLESDWAG
ncbi:aminotransferase-like domain-containing protein [Neptunicoccus cionae]|uniref:GntR family transcriptional regulator n=1 Tax=Neptunicoccus cionae TaxID=2035344 RepID=A0A916VSF5_9RHOB|nr:PLP-dependent aminotransferase family protein [Amylibacter cionae]GGA28661.1 GntR family transcriptional regulator [Amylibacter cionae]